jgi:PncC family amidohydrolase
VSEDTLAAHGAVSAETASAMALGARESLGVDVAVSVTGSRARRRDARKPVGLVFLSASGRGAELARELNLPGDREAVRRRATAARCICCVSF